MLKSKCKACNGTCKGNYFGTTVLRMECQKCKGSGLMKITRPNWNDYFMDMLDAIRLRGTCPRRQCSALIADERYILLATGYNGAPSGIDNCMDVPCGGQDDEKGDTRNCIALHAEENAILHLEGNSRNAHIMYTTNLPCFHCAKIICQSSIKIIIYREDYADLRGANLLDQKGIDVVKYQNNRIEEN